MGAERDTIVKMRCLPMSGLLSGTPCLSEYAWICLSLDMEDAQNCNRAMHFVTIWGTGFSVAVVDDDDKKVEEHRWILGFKG